MNLMKGFLVAAYHLKVACEIFMHGQLKECETVRDCGCIPMLRILHISLFMDFLTRS